jgi:hypothetical protein
MFVHIDKSPDLSLIERHEKIIAFHNCCLQANKPIILLYQGEWGGGCVLTIDILYLELLKSISSLFCREVSM